MFSRRSRLSIYVFMMMALFMATLDNQIVLTALPTIVAELGSIKRFGGVSATYLLAQSAIMPVYGKLGDLFGREYVMMFAISLFVVGSLSCGLAWSMESLIAARVLQGLGGGGIMVSIFSINADLSARLMAGAGDVSDLPDDPSSLLPEALAALPETSRIAVSMLFSDAFTWLYMVAAGLSVIGLTAAILLRPMLMPVSERAV